MKFYPKDFLLFFLFSAGSPFTSHMVVRHQLFKQQKKYKSDSASLFIDNSIAVLLLEVFKINNNIIEKEIVDGLGAKGTEICAEIVIRKRPRSHDSGDKSTNCKNFFRLAHC